MKYLLLTVMIGQVLGSPERNLPPKIFYNLKEARNLFDKYIIDFNKQYDDNEYELRLAIFKNNLDYINKFNQQTNLTAYGINQFTDLKYEEVANTYMGMRGEMPFPDVRDYTSLGVAPDRIDYREDGFVTEVKNQRACASCYIFSAIGNIEGQHAKAHGDLISLSEQQVLDCQPDGNCQTGGLPAAAMNVLVEQGGAMRNEDYPYVVKKDTCHTDLNRIAVKVTGGSRISVRNEEDLKDALAHYGPLSIGIRSCERLQHYQGGVFHYNCKPQGKHALLLVGYDTADGIPYWIIKNSWGAGWGERGYIRMEMGKSLCNIGEYVATSTVA